MAPAVHDELRMTHANRSRTRWLACAALILAARAARAAPDPETTPPPQNPATAPPQDPATAPAEDPPPPPGQESGRIDNVDGEDSSGRVAARTALFVPKLAFDVVTYPIDHVIFAEGKFDIGGWYRRWFTCCNGNIGVVPVATWATGLGFTAGAEVYDKDTFGEKERTTLEASWGGTYRLSLAATIDTGRRLGPLRLGAAGYFDRHPNLPFYGIGNDSSESEAPAQPIDAFNDPTAVHSFFRYQNARAGAFGDYRLSDEFLITGRAEYAELKYTPSTSSPGIEDVYDPGTLVGFDQTTRHVYAELELRWDTRRTADPYEPDAVHSLGSLAVVSGGYVHQFDNMSPFWHYRGDFQHYFRIGEGPRVLIGRLHGEGVTGDVMDVPITELPYLGGGTFLRGYTYARFRDRIALVGTVQYMWSLFPYASAFVFSDVGRVYRDWSDLTASGLHVGFGVGLSVYERDSFLADLTLGSSLDGGIVATAEFSPVLDAKPRFR